MKTTHTIIYIAAIILAGSLSLKAQAGSLESDKEKEYSLYQNFENIPAETVDIKFALREDSYVILYVRDLLSGVESALVEGFVSAGNHGIVHKSATAVGNASRFLCVMEVYEHEGGKLVYSSAISLQQK